MAFLLGSVFYTLKLNNEMKLSSVMKATLMLVLSVLANFNFIFTGLTLVFVIIGLIWHKRKSSDRKDKILAVLSLIFFVIPVFAYIILASFNIRSHDGFYYGSADGYFEVTLKSLQDYLGELWQVFLPLCHSPICIPHHYAFYFISQE